MYRDVAYPVPAQRFLLNGSAAVAIVGFGTLLEAMCDVCPISFPVLLPNRNSYPNGRRDGGFVAGAA